MEKELRIQELKTKFAFLAISDEDWNEIYQISLLNNLAANDFSKILEKYLKDKINPDFLKLNFEALKIDLETSIEDIYSKLAPLFNFLARIKYIFKFEDLSTLDKMPLFITFFQKIKENYKDKYFYQFVRNDKNIIGLYKFYLIEYCEDSKSNKYYHEQLDLLEKIKNGDENAKNIFVTKNINLVKKIASKYINLGLDYEDLVQEGAMGLLKAIDRYDPSKARFSTYATWWIRQGITRALADQAHTIRIPVPTVELLNKLYRIKIELSIKLNREPSEEEIAQKMKISVKKVQELFKIKKPISLETPIGDDELSLEDVIPESDNDIEEVVVDKYEQEFLKNSLKKILNPRELEIIKLRYGIGVERAYNLEEIGKKFNLSRERIRQIEGKTLQKLSRNRIIKTLREDDFKTINLEADIFQDKSLNKSAFNIQELHPNLTFSILKKLLEMFPARDIKIYCQFRGLNLKEEFIYPVKLREYSENFLTYIEYIEKDLKYMFSYYEQFLKSKRYSEQVIYQKIQRKMQTYFLRFRFSDYTQKEILEAAKRLSKDHQRLLFQRHGNHLMSYEEMTNKVEGYMFYNIYKRMSVLLKQNKEDIKNEEYTNILDFETSEDVMWTMQFLTEEQKSILFLRHTKHLNQLIPWPNLDENGIYYEDKYRKIIRRIKYILQNREKYENKVKIKKNQGLSIIKQETKENIIWSFQFLKANYINVIELRHGSNLDQTLSWSDFSFQEKRKYYSDYQYAYKRILYIIQNREKFNKRIEKTNLIKQESKEDIIWSLKFLEEREIDILYLRHGPNLDQFLSWPEKNYNYLEEYNAIYEKIKGLIKDKHNIDKSSLKNIIGCQDINDILWAIEFLGKKSKEIIYLRHGSNLDQILPWPKETEDNLRNYYPRYRRACKRIEYLIENRVDLEEKNKKIEEQLVINKYKKEDILWALEFLGDKQKEALYLRHGPNLDQILSWPKINKESLDNYYKNYKRACLKIIDIQQNKEKYIKILIQKEGNKQMKKEKNKKMEEQLIINKYKKEDILWALEFLGEKQKESIYLRYGPNLDQILSWPQNKTESKKCYQNYYYACKRIEYLIENRVDLEEKNKKIEEQLIINKYKKEDILWALEFLGEKQKEALYLRHGPNLDQILSWPKINKESLDNYYKNYKRACLKIIDIQQNKEKYIKILIQKEGNKQMKKEKNKKIEEQLIINKYKKEDILWALEFLGEKQKESIYLRHGPNLDQILSWPQNKIELKNCYQNYGRAKKRIEYLIENKKIILENSQIYKRNISCRKNNTIESNPLNLEVIQKKRQGFLETRSKLEQLKLKNFAAELFTKYNYLYGRHIGEDELQSIIECSLDSYSFDENLSLELSCQFKIEAQILLNLANKYRQNPDSESSLEILLLIEEIFGKKIKQRYTNSLQKTSTCYIPDEKISLAIESVLKEYTGRLPFNTEVSLKLKKLSK